MFRKAVLAAFLFASSQSYAAISFVNYATSAANANAVTVSEPTDTAEDDVLVGFCSINREDSSWVDPTDWTEIDQTQASSADIALEMYIGYKVRGSTAGETLTFTYTNTANIRCDVLAFRGVDTSTPLDVTFVEGSHLVFADATPSTVAQPITTTTDNAWALILRHIQDNAFTLGGPSGYTARVDEQATAAHSVLSKPVVSAGTETPGAWSDTNVASTADVGIYTIALKEAATAIAFSSGPTVAAATNGYTISGTITNENGTVYAVAVNPGASAPTCAQIRAGDDGSSVDAAIVANEAWTADAADSFALTAAGSWPRHDVHVCAYDGSADETAVTSSNDTNRSADSGQAITVTTSISATSIFALQTVTGCDTTLDSATITGCADTSWVQPGMLVDMSAGFAQNSDKIVYAVDSTSITFGNVATSNQTNITVTQDQYYSPSVAAGDVIEGNTTNSEGDAVTVGADGEISWTDTCGGCLTTWTYNIQDVSDASDGDFDSGPQAWASGDDIVYFFNTAPVFDIEGGNGLLLYQNQAMTSFDFSGDCSDVDLQSLTFSGRSGVPTGTSVSAAGVMTGTPTVVDESGAWLDLTCRDPGLLYADSGLYVYVTDDAITMPTIDDSDLDAAFTDMLTARPWLDSSQLLATYQCEVGTPDDDVISQDPAASSTIDATETVSVVLARAALCSSSGKSRTGVRLPGVRMPGL